MLNTYIKYLSRLLFLFVIITFILTYFYLRKIESCECLLKKPNNKNIDIKKVEYAQIAIIIFVIIDYMFVFNDHIDRLGTFKIILLLMIVGIYIYFLYNIYYFAQNMGNKECTCGNYWERYILYKQFMLYIFVFIIIIFAIIFNIEHQLLHKLYESSYMKHLYYLIKSIFSNKK
jgi:hypothetical protein